MHWQRGVQGAEKFNMVNLRVVLHVVFSPSGALNMHFSITDVNHVPFLKLGTRMRVLNAITDATLN